MTCIRFIAVIVASALCPLGIAIAQRHHPLRRTYRFKKPSAV